jgi:hypothetical protein
MARNRTFAPDYMPVLSPGKHRSPRRGACFMEMASYLAGERWSDHPACTHPLLADLARRVNDLSSDAGRRALVPYIPTVIGRVGTGLETDARVAWRCGVTTLPVVSAERQCVLALAVLTSSEVLGDPRLAGPTERALSCAPDAVRWARDTLAHGSATRSLTTLARYGAPVAVRTAAQGAAEACVPDVDGLLRQLLIDAIEECSVQARESVPVRLLQDPARS